MTKKEALIFVLGIVVAAFLFSVGTVLTEQEHRKRVDAQWKSVQPPPTAGSPCDPAREKIPAIATDGSMVVCASRWLGMKETEIDHAPVHWRVLTSEEIKSMGPGTVIGLQAVESPINNTTDTK